MKLKRSLSFTMALIFFILAFASCSSSFDLTLTNSLGHTIDELYLSEAGSTEWGANRIAAGSLSVGNKITVSLDKATELYDIHAVTNSGKFYFFTDLSLTPGAAVELAFDGDYAAVITPKKGDPITILGKVEGGEASEPIASADSAPISSSAPSAGDELTNSIAIPDFEKISVPYPNTMKLKDSPVVKRQVQLEAINDDSPNNIIVSWYDVGSTFDDELNSTPENAEAVLRSICEKICKNLTAEDRFIENTSLYFINNEAYYGIRYYVQMKGTAIGGSSAEDPVSGVLECRYYGPLDALLVAFSMADDDRIQTYSDIAAEILDKIKIETTWTTATAGQPFESPLKPGSSAANTPGPAKDSDEDYDDSWDEDYDDSWDEYYDEDYDSSWDEDYDDSWDEYYDEDYDSSWDEYYDEDYDSGEYSGGNEDYDDSDEE